MKKILVPTDFSENSEDALRYAIELARREKARLVLLNVYPETFTAADLSKGVVLTDNLELIEKEARKRLQKKCDELEELYELTCDYQALQGPVKTVITETAKKLKVDLIVMGMKGHGKPGHVVGSTALAMLNVSPCPLIVIPVKAFFKGIRKITFATDYHESDLPAINRIAEIARAFSAQLELVHVFDGEMMEGAEKEMLAEFMGDVADHVPFSNVSFRQIHGRDVEKRLEQYVEDTGPDLMAISSRHRGPLDMLFGKSITKEMAKHIQVPMLVFHYKQEPVLLI